jgi:hypothetical protein
MRSRDVLEPGEPVRERLDKAFSPAEEIDTPERFAGRLPQLRQALRALRVARASFLIYGHRGVGKTSFAKQVQLIAAGNYELVEALGLLDEVPAAGFIHPTAYFSCNDFIPDVPSLLQAMLTDTDQIHGLGRLLDDTILTQRTTGNTSDLGGKLFGVGANAVDTASEQRVPIRGTPVDLFRQLTLGIVEQHDNRPLVLVIDELERLKNKDGLASLIKSFTHLRFALVGVADHFHELVTDHASVDRQLSEGVIRLSPMTNSELREIFTKAQAFLGQSLVYEADAIDEIVSMANGFPHFVHFIGREVGFVTIDRGGQRVTRADVADAIGQIVETKRAVRYESMFLDSVRGSTHMEIVLRAFANAFGEEIHTGDVYPLCEAEGVTNASQYVGRLTQSEILIKTRDRYYRFDDELFRTYVKIRSWKFR